MGCKTSSERVEADEEAEDPQHPNERVIAKLVSLDHISSGSTNSSNPLDVHAAGAGRLYLQQPEPQGTRRKKARQKKEQKQQRQQFHSQRDFFIHLLPRFRYHHHTNNGDAAPSSAATVARQRRNPTSTAARAAPGVPTATTAPFDHPMDREDDFDPAATTVVVASVEEYDEDDDDDDDDPVVPECSVCFNPLQRSSKSTSAAIGEGTQGDNGLTITSPPPSAILLLTDSSTIRRGGSLTTTRPTTPSTSTPLLLDMDQLQQAQAAFNLQVTGLERRNNVAATFADPLEDEEEEGEDEQEEEEDDDDDDDDDEDLVVALPCLHVFHDRCVVPWLKAKGHCPECRLEINAQSLGWFPTTGATAT